MVWSAKKSLALPADSVNYFSELVLRLENATLTLGLVLQPSKADGLLLVL